MRLGTAKQGRYLIDLIISGKAAGNDILFRSSSLLCPNDTCTEAFSDHSSAKILMASNKRKPDSDAENSESLKRPRICNKYFIGIDPTFGQRYAIPGLDGDDTYDSDGGNDGLDPEALKYLQAVR